MLPMRLDFSFRNCCTHRHFDCCMSGYWLLCECVENDTNFTRIVVQLLCFERVKKRSNHDKSLYKREKTKLN